MNLGEGRIVRAEISGVAKNFKGNGGEVGRGALLQNTSKECDIIQH